MLFDGNNVRSTSAEDVDASPSKPYIILPQRSEQPVVFDNAPAEKPGLEAYKSLRTRLLSAQALRKFSSVCLTSPAPGDGKTLTSINLGYCCSQLDGVSTLVVDADLRTRSLTSLMGGDTSAGLADVLADGVAYDKVVALTNTARLAFVGAGRCDVSPAELFSSDRWKDFMRWATANFRLVLVDSQPTGVVADFELIAKECDAVMLVVRAARTAREELQDALALVDPAKLLGVVWNGSEDLRASYYYRPR